MTMTEPTNHSTDAKTENGQLKEYVNSEKDVVQSAAGQEVNNVDLQSGGGSPNSEARDPLIDNGEEGDQLGNDEAAAQLSRRGVKFHEGIVAGYREAPDPWKDAKGWTWQEVIAAYRKSCEKHNTKPLNRILQQIQGLVDNGKRQDLFSLKGEKLDHKHCESIEEVLRRIQFRIIDLEAAHLEDESAVALFDMIEFYDSACQLNISFNKNIALRGWQACSKLIRRTPNLTHLDMRNCDLNERSIPIIGRALKLGSPLTVLHLENISLSGRALIILVAALKMNETLLELFLADNKLMPSDGIQLGNLLKYNHKMELLDLRNNHLQDVGTSHLCDGLSEQNLETGLKTLVLWNNQITYQAMSAVGKALKCVECLETLNLGHNNVTNEGMHAVKDGLLKSKALLRLGLQGCKVTCEGAVALAEFVADSPRLVRLDLRENDIKTAGLMALSLSMRVNTSVTRMDLDKDTKKESVRGMKDYAEQQRRLHQEILTYAERNHLNAIEREEREKQEIEERARQEAARQSVEEAVRAAQESFQMDMDHIPSAEKIQRPKLLFSHILAPQQSLESPDDFKGDNIPVSSVTSPPASTQNLSLCLAPTTTDTTQLLSTPPADMLLSPQYIPKLAAKKIFSVNRVVETLPSPSTLVAGQPEVAVGIPPAVNLLTVSQATGLPSAISPTTICQNLASETVKDYIEQIVSEAENKGENSESQSESCDSQGANSDRKEADSDSQGENSDSKNVVSETGGKSQEGAEVQKVCSDTDKKMPTTEDESCSDMDASSNETDNKRTEEDRTIVQGEGTDCAVDNEQTDTIVSAPVTTENCDDRTECDKSGSNIESSETKATDPPAVSAVSQPDASGNFKTDQPSSSETEQWQNVDRTDVSQSGQSTDWTGEGEKPDFHTNLSLNGLARELASALDNVDEADNSATDVLGMADEFEKELDAMLASIGLALPPPQSIPSEGVDKTKTEVSQS